MASNDNDLRRQLRQYGVEVGPITDSTRDLYRRMLQKKIKGVGKSPKVGGASKLSAASRVTKANTNARNIPGRGSWNSPAKVANYEPRNISYAAKRPASNSNYGVEPKRPRIDPAPSRQREKTESEEEIEVSREPSKPVATSSPKYARLYPTLPDDVNSESTAPEEPPPISHRVSPISQRKERPTPQFKSPPLLHRSPSIGSASSLSPPSPSVERNKGGGLVSALSGWIGGGVRKLVNQIASPRPSIRASRKSSIRKGSKSKPAAADSFNSPDFGDSFSSPSMGESPASDHDTVSLGDVDISDMPTHVGPLSDSPETKSKEKDGYDWELQPSDVEICKKPNGTLWRLGKGGFGEVFKGLKDSVDEVAVKVIRIQNSPVAIEQFKQEIDIISKLRHRHILQFYGACIQPSCLYMVTELMQTDLFSNLRTDIRYLWTGIYGKEVLLGVASGLHYLHSRKPPIVHRDIKSPNILLMDGIAKIADVGIARTKSDSDMTAQKGFTIAWAAPEVVYRRRATEKIDMWSFGVIIWEVVTGKLPRVGYLALPSDAPPQLHALYNSCVEEDPNKRPSAAQAIQQLKAIK